MAGPLTTPSDPSLDIEALLRDALKNNPYRDIVVPPRPPSAVGRPVSPEEMKGDLGVALPKPLTLPSQVGRPYKPPPPVTYPIDPPMSPTMEQGINTVGRGITRGTIQPAGDVLKNFARDPAGILVGLEKLSPVGMGEELLKHYGLISNTPTESIANALRPDKPIEPIYKAGQAIIDYSNSPDLKAPKGWEGGFTDQFSQALGSTNLFLATSLLGPGSIPASAILGAYMSAEGQVNDAIQKGATPDQIKQASRMGAVAGYTEPAPFEIILDRIPVGQWKPAMAVIGRLLTKMAAEGGQEGLQQAWQNFTAKYIYNPNQDLSEGIAQAFGLGALVGGLYGGVDELAGGPGKATPPPGGPWGPWGPGGPGAPGPGAPGGPPLEGEIIPPDRRPGARDDRGAPIIDLTAEGGAPPSPPAPGGVPGLPPPTPRLGGPAVDLPTVPGWPTTEAAPSAEPPEGPATTGSIRTQVPPVAEAPQPMPGEEPAVLPPVPGPRFLLQKDYPAGRMGYDPAVRFEGKVYTGEMHADAVAKAMEDNPNFEAAFEANPEAYLGYQEGSSAQNARVSEATAPAPTVDLRAEAIQEARQATSGVPPPVPPQQPAGVPAVVPPTPSPPPPDELDAQMAAALEAVRGRQTDPLDQQMAAQLGTPIQLGQQTAPAPPEPGMTRLYRAEPVGDSGWASQDSQDAPGRWSENPRDALDWYHQDQGGIAPAQSVFIDVPTQQAEQYRARNLSPRAQRFSKDPSTEFFLPSDIAANRRPIPPGLVPQAQTAPSAPTVAPTEVSGGATIRPPSAVGRPLSEVATRRSPVVVGTEADTTLAGQNVKTPSQPQANAGNYRMGHLRWPIAGTRRSLSISVETPAGGVRQGKDPNAPWEVQMPVAYGYIKGTKGGENKPFDVYLGPNPESPTTFVVDQINPDTGKYDEGKGFVGFNTQEEAVQAYAASFSDGRGLDRIGAVSAMPIAEFEKYVRSDKATKPFDRAGVREARKQRVAATTAKAAAAPAPVQETQPTSAPQAPIATSPTDAAWWDSLPIEDRDVHLKAAGVVRSPKLSWKTLGEANQQKILAATQGEGLKDETRAVEEPSNVQQDEAVQRGRGRGVESEAVRGARGEGTPTVPLDTKVSRLPGLPANSPGGFAALVQASKDFLESVGIPYRRQRRYAVADVARGKRIAGAYDAMSHAPTDPDVLASYEAMIEETLAQYQFIKKLGIKIEVQKPGEEPYPKGPRQALEDIRDNNHWWLFPTESGYGTLNAVETNPLLRPTDEKIGDHVLLANDVFRIVHDFFGHAREGFGFGPNGEENAWQSHVRMYSPLAARAMTSETRGQNSWVNFGPYGEKNQADQKNTVYADQKSGLLPDWAITEGVVPDAETVRSDTRQAGEEDVVRRGAEPRSRDIQQQAQGQPSDRAERPGAPAQRQKEVVSPEERSRIIKPGLVLPPAKQLVEGRVSTRWPTGKKGENPLSHLLDLVREHVTGTPNVDLLHYVGMGVPKDAPPMERVEAYLRWTIGNILFFHDITDPDVREESKDWYEGAHSIAEAWAEQYGYPLASVAGAIAVLSPQKNWFQNISLAQRILDIHTRSNDTQFTNAMGEKLHEDLKGLVDSYPKQVAAISNAKLKDLTDPVERALWIRIYDETYNDRRYRVAHAGGRFGGFEKTLAGKLADVTWGSLNEIAKADQMLRSDGNLEKISELLGFGHKVRSFFNNIHVPWDQVFLDATMDTHSVGVGHFSPLGGGSLEVGHVLGTGAGPRSQFTWAQPQLDAVRGYSKKYGKATWDDIKDWEENNPEQFANWMTAYQKALQSIGVTKLGPSRDAQTGVKGIYPLLLTAHRTAAPQRGLLARQIQSITWDKIRKVFTPAQKRDPVFRAHIFGIWRQVDAGTLSEDDARRQIVDFANQGKAPETASKNQPGFESYAPTEVSTYEEGVHTPKLVRKTSEGGERGGAEGARPSTVAKQEVDTYDPYAVGTALKPRKPRSGLEARVSSNVHKTGQLLLGHTDLGSWEYDDALPMGGQAQEYITEQGREKGIEFLLAIDANGQVLGHGYGDKDSTGITEELNEALYDPSQSVVLHHYHPNSAAPSVPDISLLGLPGTHSIWAYGQDGSVHRIAATEAFKKWIKPFGLGSWILNTKKIATHIDDLVLAKLQAIVNAHKEKATVATTFINHLRNIVLHNAGVIDYDSNVAASAFIAKHNLQPYLDKLASDLATVIFNDQGRTTNRYADRPTVTLRHAGEVGTTFEEASELARQGGAERVPDTGRSETDSGKAFAQKWLKKLGLAEETQDVVDPFGGNPRPAKQPIFYSAVVRAVEGAKIPKGDPKQWLGYLRNQPGIKEEELDWLGVEDWLAGQTSVTKKDLTDFVRANELTVSEVVRGGAPEGIKGSGWDVVGGKQETRWGEREDLNLPGGTNATELLITLPPASKDVAWQKKRDEFSERLKEVRLGIMGIEQQRIRTVEDINKLESLKNLRKNLLEEQKALEKTRPSSTYTNPGHWAEENVVAWVRFDERNLDGKRVLFVQENQSDWHQKGQAHGYKPKPGQEVAGRPIDDIRAEFDAALKRDDYLGFSTASQARGEIIATPRDFADRWEMSPDTVALAREYIAARAGLGIDARVPDAPFKNTWQELSMKRVLRWAADNGFEGIAWTSGQMQLDRYPQLSRIVENVVVEAPGTDSKLWTVTAQAKDGTIVGNIFGKQMSEKELAKTFGKDVADRILVGEGEQSTVGGKPVKSITGLNIQLGGKLHRRLYDQQWPSYLNKLGKKYGAKVGSINLGVKKPPRYKAVETTIEDEWVVRDTTNGEIVAETPAGLTQHEAEQEALAFNASDNQRFHVLKVGDNLWEVNDTQSDLPATRWSTFKDAREHAHKLNAEHAAEKSKQEAPFFPIPNAMREAVAGEPQGLFQATRTVRPPGVPPTPSGRRSFIRRLLSSVGQFVMTMNPTNSTLASSLGRRLRSGSQLLDLPFRIPFEIFGGTDQFGRWNPGKYLNEARKKIINDARFDDGGKFTWMNTLLHQVRMGIITGYQLDLAYQERTRQAKLEKARILRRGEEFMNMLKRADIGVQEAKILHAILTGEQTTTAQWQSVSDPIRLAIEQLGQEMVLAGLLTQEEFDRHRGKYLHRIYLKWEQDQAHIVRFMSRMGSSYRRGMLGPEFKLRGKTKLMTLDQLLRNSTDQSVPQKGEKFRVIKYPTGGAVPFRYIFLRNFGNGPLPARFTSATSGVNYKDEGEWEVRGTKKGKIIIWQDYTKQERLKNGEIVDARYTLLKTFMLAAHDLSTGKLYKDIAGNPDWTTTNPGSDSWRDAAEYSRFWNDPTVTWVKVPDTTIAKSKVKRWGALAGTYVRAPIWRDLAELNRMQQTSWWEPLIRTFKVNKTARSPTTHMNNVMGNAIMMDLDDVRARDLKRALASVYREDALFKQAQDMGAFGSDYVSQELAKNWMKPLLSEIQGDMVSGPGLQPIATMWDKILSRLWSKGALVGAAGGVAAGSILGGPVGGAIGGAIGGVVGAAAKKPVDIADDWIVSRYQWEDTIFRMATYIRRIDEGATPEEAAREAHEQFLNYEINAPWINALRRTGVPFVGYTTALVPRLSEGLATRPWKPMKYIFVLAMLGWLTAHMLGDDWDDDKEEKVRRSFAERDKGKVFIGPVPLGPKQLHLPWNDSYGNPVYLDIRRWFPGGDLMDMGNILEFLPASLQPSGPILMAAEQMMNKSAYTGQPIVNDKTGTMWDHLGERADNIWKGFMPNAPWMPGSWSADKLVNSAIRGYEDIHHRPVSTTEAALSSFGIKAKGQDANLNFDYYRIQFNQSKDDLDAAIKRVDKNRALNRITTSEADRQKQSLIAQKMDLGRQEKAIFQSPKQRAAEEAKAAAPVN